MIKHICLYFKVALAAFFIASAAHAQNSGTVTQYAFAIGKGPGTTGYTSLLCASTQIAIGQTSSNPACFSLSGDVTMNASGVTAIGASKVTNSMLAGSIAASKLIGTDIATVGTITTGTWHATAIDLTTYASGRLQAAQFPALTGDVTTTAGSLATTIANNAVTNAKSATMAAYTFKGNPTGSTASPTDFTIGSLTQKASPAAGDYLIIADNAASGATKYATVASVASAGSVSSIAGNTGAFTLNATSGITNSVNDIQCSQGSSSQFGCLKVDNTTIQSTAGVISTKANTVTNSLSGNVSLSNTANYFTGPTVSQGTSGTWLASGTVTLGDTSAAATFYCRLTDGTTVIASSATQTYATDRVVSLALSGVLASPAGNIKIECRDSTSTSGYISANLSTNGKDSTLTAIRLQ